MRRENRSVADIEYSVERGVATITLNRPERKNAFTVPMIDQWAELVRRARTDEAVRVVILTGAGEAFCAGIDMDSLDEIGHDPLAWKALLNDHINHVAFAMEELDKPVIAAVSGPAVGAGMDMALMCDMRFAAPSARFSEGYIRLGLVPGDGGCYYLPRLVGPAVALELLLTGNFIDAEQAERYGIVNRVIRDGDLMEATRAVAMKIAERSPLAVRLTKRALYQSLRSDLRTSLDLISSHMALIHTTRDAAEAVDAFRTKRSPHFEGR
ncbi:enoyl-CoA hydratase [bacterium]|nr:MAG: enoyl-CoA hydratase [bacterium]